jgi:hypothetical protein
VGASQSVLPAFTSFNMDAAITVLPDPAGLTNSPRWLKAKCTTADLTAVLWYWRRVSMSTIRRIRQGYLLIIIGVDFSFRALKPLCEYRCSLHHKGLSVMQRFASAFQVVAFPNSALV